MIAIDIQASRVIVASAAMDTSAPPRISIIPSAELGSCGDANENPAHVEQMKDLLRGCLSDTNFRYARLGVSLPSGNTCIAHHPDTFSKPFSDFERVREWVVQGLSLTEEYHRTCVSPYAAGGDRERCVVAACKRTTITFWEKVADALKADLSVVTPRVSCLIRYASKTGAKHLPQNSVWIDMVEREPYLHRFYGQVPLDSSVISDLTNCRELVRTKVWDESAQQADNLTEHDLGVWCLLAEGQSVDEVSRLLRLDSWCPCAPHWIQDKGVAALGLLMMMEDR